MPGRTGGQHAGPRVPCWQGWVRGSPRLCLRARGEVIRTGSSFSESQGEWLRLWILPASRPSLPPQVDKETNTETPAPSPTVVRPKDRRVGTPSPGPFLRGSTIIRSKTFSPGPQSQYVCRVSNRTAVLPRAPASRPAAESPGPRTVLGPSPGPGPVVSHSWHVNTCFLMELTDQLIVWGCSKD